MSRPFSFGLWLACWTQEAIAEEIGWERSTVTKEIENVINGKIAKNHKFYFQDESFHVPLYNVWKVQNKSNTTSHPGNTEAQWFENVLYLYTDPFDIVIDPFAGGGSTIDVCKKRGRRYSVSDRKPIVALTSKKKRRWIMDARFNMFGISPHELIKI